MSRGHRSFTTSSERDGGVFRSFIRLTCAKCGVADRVTASAHGNGIHPDFVNKKFGQKGWSVGANEAHDFCPDCSTRRKPVLSIVDALPKAEKPREMQRSDRQVIFLKLTEVYLDEEKGYVTGWSDNRVATDLNVPRVWVNKVRDENFGPSGASEEMMGFLRDAELLLKQAVEVREEAKKIRGDIAGWAHEIEQRVKHVDDILDRLSQVESTAGKIRQMAAL